MIVTKVDVRQFLIVKTAPKEDLHKKFVTWFSSRLLGADLHEYIDATTQEYRDFIKAAEALSDKIDHMTSFDNNRADMDSVIRMLCRICDKGTKPIHDYTKKIDYPVYSNLSGKYFDRKLGSRISRTNSLGGLGKTIGHFRWNYSRVYTLHESQIKELIRIVQDMDYFSLRPDAVMFTHQNNKDEK